MVNESEWNADLRVLGGGVVIVLPSLYKNKKHYNSWDMVAVAMEIEPLKSLTIEHAECILQRDIIAPTALKKFRRDILKSLCQKFQLSVPSTAKRNHAEPTKTDYENALINFVLGTHEDSQADIEIGIEMVAVDMRSLPLEPLLVDKDEAARSVPEVPHRILCVRHFEGPKDWCHRQEIDVECNDKGDLDLFTVLQKLRMNGKVVVLDPWKLWPFLEYKVNMLEADDIDLLFKDGYLCVIGERTSTNKMLMTMIRLISLSSSTRKASLTGFSLGSNHMLTARPGDNIDVDQPGNNCSLPVRP
ncbi:uncharacterized protein LACBIDRAFT_322462 [Laccaria bicolor S238N-H82]|uniref:Predicted protein n=1 Tax=Laccaria bicolor (strain S238N-H82 / ATCC MYA-4686) TaxID=486041 RepID=B0CWD3_LACBS|nr:uncharacterized protein LACBIDRAFT_322462 [Laccaria bicolor S238N-H82]EDR13489.1 predicted protein [Laccaria bicolor S238N-H82]|eukprot:XP_001875987.1 predicted protein [Laccaria bicolor S238N-H82]